VNAEKSAVSIRISDFHRDSLQRLTAIKEVTESPKVTLDINISNISYLTENPGAVNGYQVNLRILNVSPKNYPPASYQISNIKYTQIGRVYSFDYVGQGQPQQCVKSSTHHMAAPISKKTNTPPPMLAISAESRKAMSALFGKDFQNVMVKTDPIKMKYAADAQNEVFSLGRDIYFSENGSSRITIPFDCSYMHQKTM
jgi:hypothetical protein